MRWRGAAIEQAVELVVLFALEHPYAFVGIGFGLGLAGMWGLTVTRRRP